MTMGMVLMIIGVYCVIFSLIITVESFPSVILFKVVPFSAGLTAILRAMDLLGWVNIF